MLMNDAVYTHILYRMPIAQKRYEALNIGDCAPFDMRL